jgi:hypothetical protein
MFQEKALHYDEYDALLKESESEGNICLTAPEEFKDNMLSTNVLKIDVSLYLEENWPTDDKDLEKLHKLSWSIFIYSNDTCICEL